jgi:hypothetical protein|tara:strand:+ start:1660 stop:1827 length:168 start_codon:yes stop_codon:yes gene_type:complete
LGRGPAAFTGFKLNANKAKERNVNSFEILMVMDALFELFGELLSEFEDDYFLSRL